MPDRDSISCEDVDVLISTEARTYMKRTSVQAGVSSLVGLYMATAGCPIMQRLRPMVYCHLPFATLEETVYRVLAMYMLAQHFVYREGGEPDWELKGLVKVYDDVRLVNEHFARRLMCAAREDASLNALVQLDVLADFTGFADDNSRSVVNEETRTDPGTRVDVNSRRGMGVLRHDARDERHLLLV